ncbi:hypothetical protein HRbin04_00401 [archaeon HR04]|nr:hypothetical protein HRbin04_00401 [archaeon HR04]
MNVLTACSGVSYVGMPFSLSILFASCWNMKDVSTGLLLLLLLLLLLMLSLHTSTTVLAISTESIMAGVYTTRMPSTLLSFKHSSNALLYLDASASPIRSIGLPLLQCFGSTLLSSSIVLGSNSANLPPLARSASVAIIAGPPAFVIIASLGPLGNGCFANASAQLNSSDISSTLITPALLNAAS